jgi:hypothetical protein
MLQAETNFHIFVRGGWIISGGCCCLLWRGVVATPGKVKEKVLINKICFLGLHGKIWDHNIGNFTNLVVRINQIWNYQNIYNLRGCKNFGGQYQMPLGGANHFWGVQPPPPPAENPCLVSRLMTQCCNNIVISWLYQICWNNPATSLIISMRLQMLQIVDSLFHTSWQLGASSANTTCWWPVDIVLLQAVRFLHV